MFHKIINTSKPSFIADKLDDLKISRGTRSGRMYMLPNYKLSVSKESFLYRSVQLFNRLPEEIQLEENVKLFKRKLFEWIQFNIEAKPSSRFPTLPRGLYSQPLRHQQAMHQDNDIRRYFNRII